MNLVAIALSAREALSLLYAFPFRWLIVFTVFIVAVESLMFIPYVGFLAKLSLAGLLSAQLLALCASASSGEAPRFQSLLGVFALPPASQLVLVAVALLPFLAGLAYLVFHGNGLGAIAFFFGNIFKTKPPAPDLFLAFKNVMYVTALPLTFVAAAVILRGLTGWSAVTEGLAAGFHNWLALLVVLVLSLSFEWGVGKLPMVLPRAVGTTLSMVLVLAFVAWSSAFVYTLSVRALGLASQPAI